jgi:hypothetical protein
MAHFGIRRVDPVHTKGGGSHQSDPPPFLFASARRYFSALSEMVSGRRRQWDR